MLLIRGSERNATEDRSAFDPVVEGARHRLAADLSLAIWTRVCADATDSHGQIDVGKAAERFRKIAAQGGRLGPDVGKLSGVEIEDGQYGESPLRDIVNGVPGRITQVAGGELRRTDPANGVPGRVSQRRRADAGHDEAAVPMRQVAAAAAAGAVQRGNQFYQFLTLGLRHALRLARAHGGQSLFDAMLHTGRRVEARGDVPPAMGPGTDRDPGGRAMWRAGERHAATLYRRARDAGAVGRDDPAVEAALQRCGAGQPLAAAVRRTMEAQLGVPLDRVRIHTDRVAAEAARAVNAEAFALGEDIFFAEGAYAPDTRTGQRLLAHELAHVVQAWHGRTGGGEVSDPDDPLEREAEAVADRVDRGGGLAVTAGGSAGHRPPSDRGASGPTAGGEALAQASAPVPAAPGQPSRSAAAAAQPSPPVAPAASARSQPLLRKATTGVAQHMPLVHSGAKSTPLRSPSAKASPSDAFASRARSAVAHSAGMLNRGLAHATANPPGKRAHEHGKASRKASQEAELAARAQAHDHHRVAAEHAQHKPEAHAAAPAAAAAASGAHGGIKLKPIDDWSKFMPAPMPDQDERERARILKLVRGKIEGERSTTAEAYDKLRVAHLQQASAVRASVPALQAQITASQQQALGHVASGQRAQAAAVHSHIAGVQAAVASHAAAEKAKVSGAHAAAVSKITADHAAADKLLTDDNTAAGVSVDLSETFALIALAFDFAKLRSDFASLGSKKAGDALAVGEQQANAMAGQWDGDKLSAARKAARDTADGFATQMPDQAMASYGEIEKNRPEAEQSLHDFATTTRTNLGQIYTTVKQTLDAIKTQSIQAADAARSAALAEIDQASASTNAGLAAQSAAQVAAINQQGSAARTQITRAGAAGRAGTAQLAEQTASGLEGGAAGIVRGAAQIEAPQLDDVARTVGKGTADLTAGAAGINKSVSQSATDTSEGLASQASGAVDGMVSLARTAAAQATQAGAGARKQISSISQGAIQSFGQLSAGSKTTFDKTTGDAKISITQQTTALDTAYAGAVTDRATSFAGSLGQCKSQLDGTVPDCGGGSGGAGSGKKSDGGGDGGGGGPQGEVPAIQDAAKKAADAVKPWWQKALAIVVAVVVSIAVVIIVTALIATTGPVGMILVGAAAGALSTVAGTMASNLVLGNGLMDGITWKSVAIGALGGALCAGATAGLGAAAKAVAGSARVAAGSSTAVRAVGVAAKALDTSEGVVGGFQAGAIRYGANLVVNLGGSELATFAVEHKLDLSLETLLLTVGMAKLPGKFEQFQAKVQTKIQGKIPFGYQVGKTTIGNPAKVRGSADGGGAPAAAAAPSAGHEPGPAHGGAATPASGGKPPASPAHGGDPAPATGARDPGSPPRGASDPAPSGAGDAGKTGPGSSTQPGAGDRPSGAPHEPGPSQGKPGDTAHAGDGKPGDTAHAGDGKPGEGKPGDPAHAGEGKPGDPAHAGEGKPGEGKPGDPAHAGEGKPGDPAHAGEGKPGDPAHAGEGKPGEAKPGDGKPGEGKPGDHAPTGDDAAAGGHGEPAGGASDAQRAHDQARDGELNRDGYPEGTRAKADDTAAKIEQGGKPGKDGLRDTEANARGREQLEQMLKDPKLSPEDRTRIERELANELRGKPDPTGRLDHDLEQAKAKAEHDHEGTPRDHDAEHLPDELEHEAPMPLDHDEPGEPVVRPEEPGRRGALRRAVDRASRIRNRTLATGKHYASKVSELRQLDRRAIPATRLRAAIMTSTKARTVRSIKLSELDMIHPIANRDTSLAKAELRAGKLRDAADRVREQGGLDEALQNELIPSNSLIRVVKYRDRYMVFDGNGRIEAIRRAFPEMRDLEITVLEFETSRDLSTLIDKARDSSLKGDGGAGPAQGPHEPAPPQSHDRPPGAHEPTDRAPGAHEPTDRGPAPHDEPGASPRDDSPFGPAGDGALDLDNVHGVTDDHGGHDEHPHPGEIDGPAHPHDTAAGGGHDHGGLADPAAVQHYVADLRELQGRWSSLDPQRRATALRDIINRRLAESGLPPAEVHMPGLPAGTRGRFNPKDWAIELHEDLVSGRTLDPDAARQLASTLAHEAHHGEQYFLAARGAAEPYRAGGGQPARLDKFLEFMKKKGINPDAARAAFEAPPLSPAESAAAGKIYRDLFSPQRAAVYREMNAAKAAYDKATAEYEASKTPETIKARSDALRRLGAAQQAYRDLPEEVAAREVGGAAGDEFAAQSGGPPAEPTRPRTRGPARPDRAPGGGTDRTARGDEPPQRSDGPLRSDELTDGEQPPHPADLKLGDDQLTEHIDHDRTIRDAIAAMPEHLRPTEDEIAAHHDELVATLDEWIRSGPGGPETVARGETAHNRVYAELEDLGRALVGTVRSSGNLARERTLAKETRRSPQVLDGVAGAMRKINDRIAADFAADGKFARFAQQMRADVGELRSRYLHWYVGRDVFSELANPSRDQLDSNIALLHDLEDYFRHENPFNEKFYGDFTHDQRVGSVGADPDDRSAPLSDEPLGDYRSNWTSVKEDNPWIRTARAHDTPVWAGPSVTTGRMLTFAKAAGATPEELTALAWGVWSFWNTSYNTGWSGIHTFHEVMDIARGFGVDYTPFEYPAHPPGTEKP